MRNEFFKLLMEEMRRDESVFFIAADMGLGIIEPFQQEFPDRVINTGIAEQNMIGLAAGLCNTGFTPFCYTISNFLIERCFEQIRNDICLHEYPVTLVGTSTGFDNGLLGPTHQVIDDIGCLKVLPGMHIYSPGSVQAIEPIFKEITDRRKPSYIRIGKGSYNLQTEEPGINSMVVKNATSDTLVITHGTVLENCVKAAVVNNNFSVSCMNKVKPVEPEVIKSLFERYTKVVVVEDHFVTSGLYNTLCQYVVDLKIQGTRLYAIGTPEKYEKTVGDQNYFADKYGFSPEKIAGFISEIK